jgi:site-specific recombinase XerC
VRSNLDLYTSYLQAKNRSPATVYKYVLSAEQLIDYLDEHGMPNTPDGVKREHIDAFIVDQLAKNAPSTAATRFGALQAFFKFLVEEGEIDVSPMAKMTAPTIPEALVPVVSDDDFRAMLKGCERDFEGRRDEAILRLFMDTGMRCAELTGLKVTDLDLDAGIAFVMGKGARPRACPVAPSVKLPLARYLKLRARLPTAREDGPLWMGKRGPMTTSGVRQMVARRSEAAGLGKIHPHQFRHSFANNWLAAGGQEGDLIKLGGWARNSPMIRRYGASNAAERALKAHAALGVGDRF